MLPHTSCRPSKGQPRTSIRLERATQEPYASQYKQIVTKQYAAQADAMQPSPSVELADGSASRMHNVAVKIRQQGATKILGERIGVTAGVRPKKETLGLEKVRSARTFESPGLGLGRLCHILASAKRRYYDQPRAVNHHIVAVLPVVAGVLSRCSPGGLVTCL